MSGKGNELTPLVPFPTLGRMDPAGSFYRTRLDGLSFLLLFGLALPPLVLGFALGGIELALIFLILTIGLGLFRTSNKNPFPGTLPLSRQAAPGLFT